MKKDEIKNKVECPYCLSNHVSFNGDGYMCMECGQVFHDDDVEREELRHRLSAILGDGRHDESNPLPFQEVRQDLSDAWRMSSVFMDSEGIIWFNNSISNAPYEFDFFSIPYIRDMLNKIEDYVAESVEEPTAIVKSRKEDDVTYEVCPHCGAEVELKAELMVQTCPNCGKRIVTCSMCRACDTNEDYCTRCCLCHQADEENKEMESRR